MIIIIIVVQSQVKLYKLQISKDTILVMISPILLVVTTSKKIQSIWPLLT